MKRRTELIFVSILLAIFFILNTRPIVEGDIFWHIKTGEWIWEHKSLLSEDPFTYTSQSTDPLRPHAVRYEVILKGYWISQLIFYFIWSMSGVPGIVVVRALMLVAIMLVLYLWMRKRGVSISIAVIFLFLIGYYMKDMTDRPQNFSFLFFPITAILLESLRPSAQLHTAPSPKTQFLWLPLMMLIWSNMHGGYITGVMLILIYLFFESIVFFYRRLKQPHEASTTQYKRFAVLCIISAVATVINPTTYKSFLLVIQQIQEGPKTVSELMTPLQGLLLYGDYKPTYWIMLVITTVVLILRIKHILNSRFMALIVFGIASFLAQRNITFFFCLAPLVAIEYSEIFRHRFRRLLSVIATLAFIMIMLISLSEFKKGRLLQFGIASGLYPEGAVNFMKIIRPSGNIFNLAEWGSYMILTMPEYKVFDDGRRLMDDIELAHIAVLFPAPHMAMGGIPEWKAILNAYQINIIIIPSVSPFLGDFFPIVASLYLDNDFSLVYQDYVSLIFLRKGSNNDGIIWRYSTPKSLALIQAIETLSRFPRSPAQKETNEKIIADLRHLMATTESAQ